MTRTLTLTPTQPFGGLASALEVGRGSIEFTCKSENLAWSRRHGNALVYLYKGSAPRAAHSCNKENN